ncbi:proprotein convertase P-domain-containing protein, partial [Patiriisocius hiemis]
TVTLDEFGMASITEADIDNGSSDNCPGFTLSASQTSFDCSDVGDVVVTLTVTDASGNTDTCDATVTVVDDIAPVIVCEGQAGSAVYSDAPGLVFGNPAPVVTSIINVTDDVILDDVNINLDITHAWVGDIDITLTSPAGTVVQIKTIGIDCGNADILATVDDDGVNNIDDVCDIAPAIGGVVAPSSPLAAFNGESSLGDWTLTVEDTFLAFDDGVFNAWDLILSSPDLALPALDVVLDVDGMATINAADLLVSADDACGVEVTVPGGVNISETGDNLGTVISDAAPVESVASITDSGTLGTDITLDNVGLDITHTWAGDLEITLTSPAGTVLVLSDNNGGSDDNYTNTVFQDGGDDITAANAPFTGTFEAQGGTFAATFAGESITGDWTLTVTDTAAGDEGTLNDFSITFTQDTIVQFTCADVGINEIEVFATDPSGNVSS